MVGKAPTDEASRNNGAKEAYEKISERLSFGGKPLEILGKDDIPPGQEEWGRLVNGLYFKLGTLLEELSYQSAERAPVDRRYELALGEIGLVTEFVVKLAERDEGMNMLSDPASEELYRRRGDDVRFWVGDFDYEGERVDVHVMVRPRAREVLSSIRPGMFEESRQARLGVELLSRRYKIAIRFDPGRPICIDLDAPVLGTLAFEDVNQSAAHHFYTDTKITAGDFEHALNLFISAFDSRAEQHPSIAH